MPGCNGIVISMSINPKAILDPASVPHWPGVTVAIEKYNWLHAELVFRGVSKVSARRVPFSFRNIETL